MITSQNEHVAKLAFFFVINKIQEKYGRAYITLINTLRKKKTECKRN